MFMTVLIALAAALAVFLVVAALKAPGFTYTRSAVVAAPPATVFGIVDDIRRWPDWSPWAKKGADAMTTYAGPASGVGATWSGDSEMGEGSLRVTASRPNERIEMALVFVKPMKANHTVVFTFEEEGAGTRVTWTMTGKHNFIGKAFSVVVNMDKMVGAAFERGLAALGRLAEARRSDGAGRR